MGPTVETPMYEFTFEDGTKTNLTLAFYKLLLLRGVNPALYKRYNVIQTKTKEDEPELDTITCMYTAYVCAHIGEKDLMTEEQFMIKCGSNRKALNDAMLSLMGIKKNEVTSKSATESDEE